MTAAWHLEQQDSALNWQAGLNLGIVRRGERSMLEHVSHRGPLRIQRPLLPEGAACPHLYILHPPAAWSAAIRCGCRSVPGGQLRTADHAFIRQILPRPG